MNLGRSHGVPDGEVPQDGERAAELDRRGCERGEPAREEHGQEAEDLEVEQRASAERAPGAALSGLSLTKKVMRVKKKNLL